jgi:hypothetical protein
VSELDQEEFGTVHVVQLQLCDPCIDGEGDECHTPGCSLWLNRSPDIGLRDNPSVTIATPAEPKPAPELATTASRLGHALAALREIAEPSDDSARDIARNALNDDKAIREGTAANPDPGTVPAPDPRGCRLVAHEMLRSFGQLGDGRWQAKVGDRVFAGWLKRANGEA